MDILSFTVSSDLRKMAQISLLGKRGLWDKWSVSSGGLYRPLHSGSSVREGSLNVAGIVAGGKALAPFKGLPTTLLAQSSLTAITHKGI